MGYNPWMFLVLEGADPVEPQVFDCTGEFGRIEVRRTVAMARL